VSSPSRLLGEVHASNVTVIGTTQHALRELARRFLSPVDDQLFEEDFIHDTSAGLIECDGLGLQRELLGLGEACYEVGGGVGEEERVAVEFVADGNLNSLQGWRSD